MFSVKTFARLPLAALIIGQGLSAFPLVINMSNFNDAQVTNSGLTSTQFFFKNNGGGDTSATGDGTLATETSTGMRDFQIGSSTGFVNPGALKPYAVPPFGFFGLLGNVTGTFNIGAISSCGGTCQQASVTSSGASFDIYDENSPQKALHADLVWSLIKTDSSTTLNPTGSLNLSNISYTGNNLALKEIATAASAGQLKATFTFSGANLTLSQLTDGRSWENSYQLILEIVPEPTFYAAVGLGMAVLFLASYFRKRSA